MLNDSDNRNPSEKTGSGREQVTLRIPSVRPIVTWVIGGILVLVLLARMTATPATDQALMTMGIEGQAVLAEAESFRLASALVLLAQPYGMRWWVPGLSALLSLYTLYIVGNSAERLWGHLRFGLVYVVGGITGALVTLVLVSVGFVPVGVAIVAAPNAIVALLSGEVVYMYRHRKLYGKRGGQRQRFLGGIAALNVVLGAFAPTVDLFGIMGGLLGGVLLAWYVTPLHVLRSHPDKPGALLGEDVNPLRGQLVPLAFYLTGLVGLLALGMTLMR
jgi:rhomboid protease GluP